MAIKLIFTNSYERLTLLRHEYISKDQGTYSSAIFFESSLITLILQHKPILRLALPHRLDGVVGLVHRILLDPSLDALLGRELKHLANDFRAADGGTDDGELAGGDEIRNDTRKGLLRQADKNELAVGTQEPEILIPGEIVAAGSANDVGELR